LVSEVIGPCPDTLVVSGGEGGPQSDYMGSYAKTSSPGGAYNGGRPIYKNSKNKYMFYWYATGKWFAGRDYNSDIVGLKSEADAAQCPHTSIRWDAMGWGADGKPSWAASSPVFVAEPMPCPDVVFAHGGEASHSIFMGNYTKTSILPLANNGGRPIYANSNNQHMFYRSDIGQWFVGARHDEDVISMRSAGAAQCPHKAGAWQAASGSDTWTSGISVVEAG